MYFARQNYKNMNRTDYHGPVSNRTYSFTTDGFTSRDGNCINTPIGNITTLIDDMVKDKIVNNGILYLALEFITTDPSNEVYSHNRINLDNPDNGMVTPEIVITSLDISHYSKW